MKHFAMLVLTLLCAASLYAWVPPARGPKTNAAPTDGQRTWAEVKAAIEKSISQTGLNDEGHYNDMGVLDLNGTLTEEEERTQIVLWSALCSPMLTVGDSAKWRASTRKLWENRDLENVSQDVVGHQAYPVAKQAGALALLKDCWGLNGTSKVITFYNPTEVAVDFELNFADAELGGDVSVNDVIDQAPSQKLKGSMKVLLPPHGAKVFRLFGQKALPRRRYDAFAGRAGLHGADLQFRHVYAPKFGTYRLRVLAPKDAAYGVQVNGLTVRKDCRGSVTLDVTFFRADNFVRIVSATQKVPQIEAIEIEQ